MKNLILLSAIFFLSTTLVQAQNQTIYGTVFDSPDRNPLPGVSVVEKGTSHGTITDINGVYQIEVSDSAAILVFSFIGYLNEEIRVKDKTIMDVRLTEDIVSLDEVVVVGYGVQKRYCVTGAISSISNKGPRRQQKSRNNPPAIHQRDITNPAYTYTNSESYANFDENEFKVVHNDPLSTFSIDVDRASYANVRRFLNQGQLPPADAVRIEEMINYFKYEYPEPEEDHPIAIISEVAECPWNEKHKLMHIGMQAKSIEKENLPASNLVFLIDVSGSMGAANKLPLLKQSLRMLVEELRPEDRVAIVVYAGAAGCVLPSTPGDKKEGILQALDNLNAGGSTAGGAGIKLAYDIAEKNFVKNGNNRVILATDGDFNVGAYSNSDMELLIEEKRKSGVFLTCLGYGMGNYKDSKMEILADKGNGNYAYIDNIQEAEKQLVEEFGGTLFTIAKDVKIQIEFNPAEVQAYRLVGYENRLLNDEDFKDDTKDAGEIGAGQTVTALYEIIPAGVNSEFNKDIDPLKYQQTNLTRQGEHEIAAVKVRYKEPKSEISIPFEIAVKDLSIPITEASENLRFASSVAMFGMWLRESEYVEKNDYKEVITMAEGARGTDREGYKAEFVRLVKAAGSMR